MVLHHLPAEPCALLLATFGAFIDISIHHGPYLDDNGHMTAPTDPLKLPHEVQELLGAHLKRLRLDAGYKRTTLATRAGVSSRSLQRFEDTGEISLKSLLKLAHALARLNEFTSLLAPPAARSLQELQARSKKEQPKRGRI